MRVLYGEGFGEHERIDVAPVIIANLIDGTETILLAMNDFGLKLVDTASFKAARDVFESKQGMHYLPIEVARAITVLWNDAIFQKAYSKRSQYQLFDCYADFAKSAAKKYPRWGGEGWIPSVGDVMKARVRTSGIVEEKFIIKNTDLRMYDVGGQRNERKKWIHCFENVTAVIFVGAISEYDQVLYEDATQNRLVEAVLLFEEIANCKWFSSTAIILFLNKRDLFEDKFAKKQVPLNVTGLPLFQGAPEKIRCRACLQMATEAIHETGKGGKGSLYTYYLCNGLRKRICCDECSHRYNFGASNGDRYGIKTFWRFQTLCKMYSIKGPTSPFSLSIQM